MYDSILYEITSMAFDKISKVVFSGSSGEMRRITLRPLLIKGKPFWQCEKNIGTKVYHANIEFNSLKFEIDKILLSNKFSDVNIFTIEENISYHLSKKGKSLRTTTKLEKKRDITLSHDRKKNYILAEGMEIPALVDLGVFDSSYRLIKGKNDKFVQINKFIEIIDAELKNFKKNSLTIVDFGCGKSYLTFIVYYYFAILRGIQTTILGYDLKSEVIEECQKIAKRYGYSEVNFHAGDISKMQLYADKVDMMLTLHACDTATDYALEYAIKNKVQYVFSVPCCQQEINQQIKFDNDLFMLGRHGLYKERFSAILTDCIRCEVLREFGYNVDVIEFVDFSNTPKNAMIRASLTQTQRRPNLESLQDISSKFNISHKLVNLIKK